MIARRVLHRCSVVLWFLLLCGLMAGRVSAAEPGVLVFGSYATERPAEELRKMEPFRAAIEQGLRERAQALRVEVRIFPNYDEGVRAIETGEVDCARLGPATYVMAKERNPQLHLLAAEAHQGKMNFSGIIIVHTDSTIRNLADLRGKKFAFGDPSSATGRYLAQAELTKAGITAKDLAGYEYLGRHDKVAFAVASGTHDAGATNERTFEKYAAARGLRALVRFPSPTQAWVARAGLDPKVMAALQSTLLAMTGAGLEYIGRNGFLPPDDGEYDAMRKVIEDAQAFGG